MTTLIPTIPLNVSTSHYCPEGCIDSNLTKEMSALQRSFNELTLNEISSYNYFRKILISASSCVPTFKPDFASIKLKVANDRIPTDDYDYE
jgi:hypothetical protein